MNVMRADASAGSSAPQTPAPTPANPSDTHTVAPGETITSIAQSNYTTPAAVLQINPQVRDPDLVRPGEVLNLPPPSVAPATMHTVDAVLGGQATPGQRNEAYRVAQTAVEDAGNRRDQVQLATVVHGALAAAGLPVIAGSVMAAVDQALGPQATLDQRNHGYRVVQGYVEKVGGVNDQGITAEALPAQAAELLKADGMDVALDAEVMRAVDGLLKPDASGAEREAAYDTVQRYVDAVGGVGDAGITEAALPARAARLLLDGNPGVLKFDPTVVSVVKQMLPPQASDKDTLTALQTVQGYVDDVGGVGDQGITAEYLPIRAAELLKEKHIALNSVAVAGASADGVIAAAQSGATAAARASALGKGFESLSVEAQQQLLKDPRVQSMLQQAANEMMAPLTADRFDDQTAFLKAMQALDNTTDGMPPTLVVALLNDCAPVMQHYCESTTYQRTGPEGFAAFLRVTDRASRAPDGAAVLEGLAKNVQLFNRNVLQQHISEGGLPAYALALDAAHYGGNLDIGDNMKSFLMGRVGDTINRHNDLTAELNWLIANHGPSMTQAQLADAIKAYTDKKGPAWAAEVEKAKIEIAEVGLQFKEQLDQLDAAGKLDDVKALLEDPRAQYAITLASEKHPEAFTDASLKTLAADAKNTDAARKTLGIVANNVIKQRIMPALQGYDPSNPATAQRLQAELNKVVTGPLATALGVDEAKLRAGVDALVRSAAPGAATAEELTQRMQTLKNNLDGLGMAKETPAGQLFRGLGVALGSVGLGYSLEKASAGGLSTADRTLAWAKVTSDTIGLSQKTAELLTARGGGDAWLTKLGSKGMSNFAGGVSVIVDGAFAVSTLSKGDYASSALYAVSAAGGALVVAGAVTSLSWAGPVGIGLGVIAAVGLGMVNKVKDSNKYMTDTSADFLKHAGLSGTAARALVDQSGDGYSPVAMLTHYAELKGLDLEKNPADQKRFADWINGMSIGQLESLRDAMHCTEDALGGNVTTLNQNTSQDRYHSAAEPLFERGQSAFTVANNVAVATLGDIDALLGILGYRVL